MDQFKNNLDQHTFREQVASEIKEGISYGIQGTPAFFNNENFYEDELSYKVLRAGVDYILIE